MPVRCIFMEGVMELYNGSFPLLAAFTLSLQQLSCSPYKYCQKLASEHFFPVAISDYVSVVR